MKCDPLHIFHVHWQLLLLPLSSYQIEISIDQQAVPNCIVLNQMPLVPAIGHCNVSSIMVPGMQATL